MSKFQLQLGRSIAIDVIRQSAHDARAGLEGSAVALLMCARSIARDSQIPEAVILASVLQHAQDVLDETIANEDAEYIVLALRDLGEPS
jgi:hypothetical protein